MASNSAITATSATSDESTCDASSVTGQTLFSLLDEPKETPSGPQLPMVLGTRDLTVLFILTVLFLANTGGVQFGGAAAFLYWGLGLLTFLLPCAYVTRWLARRFPEAGGHYLWATRVLGVHWGFLSAFCAWLPCVLAVIAIVAPCLALLQYLFPAFFTSLWQPSLCVVVLVVVASGITSLPLRWLKHILFALTILYIAMFVCIGFVGVWWMLLGRPTAAALTSSAGWRFSTGNFAVYGVVILALLGADTPLFLSGEIRGGRDGVRRASRFVWWGTIIAFLAYVAGTFGIFVIVPPDQAGGLAASALAIQFAFGVPLAHIAGVLLLLGQVAIISAYILMSSRVLVILAADRRLPSSLMAINRHGVPLRSILIQSAIIAVFAMIALVFAPGLFITVENPTSLGTEIYNVLQASAAVLWTCSTIQEFALVFILLRSQSERVHVVRRQQLLLFTFSGVGVCASLVGIWETLSSSWIPMLMPNTNWTEWIVGVCLLSLLVGWMMSEIPRISAMLSEQRRLNEREVALRAQLQEAYMQQETLVMQLKESYSEQEMLVLQQQELLTEVDRLYREQAQAAITDAITGLPNHRAVMARLEEELARCTRTNGSCAVLFVDLDHFKHINDTWGHRAGDVILRETAARLQTSIRIQDFVGRYGGEEFALVLTDVDLTKASEIAERLRVTVHTPPCLWQTEDGSENITIPVTASIGVAMYGLHATAREELLELADHAMYEAKQGGRNRVRVAEIREVANIVEGTAQRSPLREETTVQVLTTAAAIHDPGTDDHAHRLVSLARATAQRLHRPEEELHLIRLGALLHDIGKIGIPDAILHKPGPLTDEEWAIMRQHPTMGQQILVQAGGVFVALAQIVAAHHERWDGRGYPLGLVGKAIPFAARILAVVDSYDAMTSRRVYREPLSVEDACKELQRCAGSQYDPRVVEAFLNELAQLHAEERQQEIESSLSEHHVLR